MLQPLPAVKNRMEKTLWLCYHKATGNARKSVPALLPALQDKEGKTMDELLIRRAQEGDPDAFERLMTPLEGMVWRICWHYMGER